MLGLLFFFVDLCLLLVINYFNSVFGLKFSALGFSHFSSRILLTKRLKIGKGFYFGRNIKIELRFARGCSIGKRFTFKDNSIITSRGNLRNKSGYLSIGNNVGFSENCCIYLRGDVTIGNDCIFGPGVKILTDSHTKSVDGLWRLGIPVNRNVVIGNNVWCGANVTLMPGVRIGNNVVIGAGSVVTKNIPNDEIWVGVPAKKLK